MTTNQLTLTSLRSRLCLLAGLLLLPLTVRAADIDIYSGLSATAGAPNVLIVLDNAANFSAAAGAGAGTCMLTNTATGVTAQNSLAGTTGGIEQCAFYNVLKGMPTNADGTARINIGFMVYNQTGIVDYQGLNCASTTGGCLVYPLKPMAGTTKTDMLNWITTWDNPYTIKASNQATAATMQEAWAYYAGKIGLSGRNYASIQPVAGCQKNFVIFVGNAYNVTGTPGDNPGPEAALTAAYGGATVPPRILGTLNTTCGSYTFPSNATHESRGHYADEWARFMSSSTDLFSTSSGQQNIITYTIGVHGPSCQAEYAAQLSSMAAYGKGKYFVTSDDNSVVQALLKILNEVQAVNSVFSSATLPVSVNTQGTYLNQIYMGMFRPDSGGNPRWVGNVKQYQFAFDLDKNLYLADATKAAAISSAGTGFITPGAASFWSCTNPTNAATLSGPPAPAIPYSSLPTCALDPSTGFWKNYPDYVAYTAGKAFDLPDGEVVEKGGAGQQLRLINLTVDYAVSPAAPRRLYTDCPSGSGCVSNLSDASNAFATSNANITAAMFGTGLNLPVSSITRSGSVATATTSGNHGLLVGNTVTVTGAVPNDYNGLVTVTAIPASNQFRYAVQEYPPVTATVVTSSGIGGYVASQPGGTTTYAVSTLVRTAAGTNANATVTATMASNPFVNGDSVTIGGATPSNYNLTQTVFGTTTTAFSYSMPVNPAPVSSGSYVVSLANASLLSVASLSCATSTKIGTLTTTTSHGLRTGDQVTISGDTQSPKPANGTFYNITVLSPTSFTYQTGGCPGVPTSGTKVQGGPVSPLAVTLARNETTVGAATVTGTLALSSQFANGDQVNITAAPFTTTPANETNYLVSSATISCASNPCGTQFTYTITTTPATQPSGSITAAGAAPSQPVTSLTRSGTTATATVSGAGFLNGVTVDILTAPGTTLASNEGAYTGSKVITCVGGSPCTTFTYGPLELTPVTPATGSMSASNPGLTPDRTSVINWVRGEDNYGDEASPGAPINVRPSVHGDTLHSRPVALNYGGSTGVVVFYGTNDGVYHAINGNQTATIGSVPAGGELWGFIAKDFYGKFNRLRTNSPVLQLPTTLPGILPTPQPKDYFIDGPTGVYQTIDGNGVTTRAIIYVAARRGGRFIHAIDVTNPTSPQYLWKISNAMAGFEELGQTWSLPKIAKLRGYANPVLIFGAGYDDGSNDSEPPGSAIERGFVPENGADTMGRGIFIVDAFDGHLVWQTTHYPYLLGYTDWWFRISSTWPGSFCTGTPPAAVVCQTQAMNYSMPADVTLLDKDADGYVDRLYATDNGGNVWRMDFEPATGNTPDKWQVTQLAALGCNWGPCNTQLGWQDYPSAANPAATQRKFFFPPEVVGATYLNNYDAVFVGTGDREHPLQSQAASLVTNRMYMIKDFNTGKDSVSQRYPITESGYWGINTSLANCTGTVDDPTTLADETAHFCTAATTGAATDMSYDKLTLTQQRSGYYFSLRSAEKVVNAPLVTAGYVYFGTNQPTVPDPLSCTTNLGVARGYQLSPFSAAHASVIYDGGGLPPSPVSGIVEIHNGDGTISQAPFCVGCATALTDSTAAGGCSNSALEGCKPAINVDSKRTRNYWFLNNK